MIKPDTLKALKVIALAHADGHTYDAWYKSLCRWYSREFHTPLHTVMDMSEEDVIRTWFEDVYWKLRSADNEEAQDRFDQIIVETVAEGDTEAQVEIEEVEAEDDDWYQRELADIDKKMAKQDAEIARKSMKKAPVSMQKKEPNLGAKPITRFVQGEDPFPDDEGS